MSRVATNAPVLIDARDGAGGFPGASSSPDAFTAAAYALVMDQPIDTAASRRAAQGAFKAAQRGPACRFEFQRLPFDACDLAGVSLFMIGQSSVVAAAALASSS